MNRLFTILFAITVGACGGKSFGSICDSIPAPAACMEACDSQPGAPNTCPTGYHCSPDGKCDAQCTVGGSECGDGYVCTADGTCQGNGSGSDAPDANCPAVHFTPMKTTPSIELVLDRSGSMSTTDIAPNRYAAMHTGLTGAMGAITSAQADVYFGAFLFSGDQCPLTLAGFSVPRALNNATVIDTLIATHSPGGSTPTADAITLAAGDFTTNPPPPGSPPIILLATDGQPNSCGGGPDNGTSVNAVKAAYTGMIRTFVVGLQLNDQASKQFLQDVANAGVGKPTGMPPGCATCAPFYTANDPTSLVNGFNSIINGVLSCDLTITGMVDPATASGGSVTLNGMPLMYGTDWTVDPNGMTIHLLGGACTTLKNSPNATVDASFPCGSVIF